jgi:hypothetical protein
MGTDTNTSLARSSGTKTVNEPSSSSQDVVVDCLSTYAQVYRETLTPELIVAYQACLGDLNPRFLARAFRRAMTLSKFRPTPAEVREAYAVEVESAPKPKQLEEPPMNAEDRAEVEQMFAKLRTMCGIPPAVNVEARKAELRRQSAEILAKHPRGK